MFFAPISTTNFSLCFLEFVIALNKSNETHIFVWLSSVWLLKPFYFWINTHIFLKLIKNIYIQHRHDKHNQPQPNIWNEISFGFGLTWDKKTQGDVTRVLRFHFCDVIKQWPNNLSALIMTGRVRMPHRRFLSSLPLLGRSLYVTKAWSNMYVDWSNNVWNLDFSWYYIK